MGIELPLKSSVFDASGPTCLLYLTFFSLRREAEHVSGEVMIHIIKGNQLYAFRFRKFNKFLLEPERRENVIMICSIRIKDLTVFLKLFQIRDAGRPVPVFT